MHLAPESEKIYTPLVLVALHCRCRIIHKYRACKTEQPDLCAHARNIKIIALINKKLLGGKDEETSKLRSGMYPNRVASLSSIEP